MVVPEGALLELRDDGTAVIDPERCERILVDPSTPGFEHEPWPLAGMEIEGKPPREAIIPTSWVEKRLAEGLVTLEGDRVVHRPGGPQESPWRVTHTFRHADTIVLHCASGDVRYRVVENPDKWPAEKNARDEGFGGDVRWFYRARLA